MDMLVGSGLKPHNTIKKNNFLKKMTQEMLFGDDVGGNTSIYFNGMNLELWVAPIPGRPCLTGLYVNTNSPK